MNSKRRLRAVFLSALLVFACLTAIPAPSEAFPIKWLFYTPTVGDPDVPVNGTWLVKFRGLQLVRLGSQLVVLRMDADWGKSR